MGKRLSDGTTRGLTRRRFLKYSAAGVTAAFWYASERGWSPLGQPPATPAPPRARVSVRIGVPLWMNPRRREELLALLKDYPDTIEEVAFFTGLTHPPLPLAEVEARAITLAEIIPQFKAIGRSIGINHLSTLGHLDENLENSLREPWQHLVDFNGAVSVSCYCAADPDMQEYIRRSYVSLAKAKPDFIWVDDDLRLESHGPIRCACFCNRCMAQFSRETGKSWTRESLVAALRGGSRDERLALRKQWLAHNRSYLGQVLSLVRAAIDTVDPTMPLGLMTAELAYSGYGFGDWAPALAGPRSLPVKWRPGGGFYTDDVPAGVLTKAHSTGRQIAFLPPTVTEIQYEHENFPYQRLKKSVTIFTAEIAAAIGAGCTGAALNCLGLSSDPFDEYRPYLDGVASRRSFYNKAVATLGRSPCEGIWTAFTRDNFAVLNPDGDWFSAPGWGSDLQSGNELAEIGLPPAYARPGARVVVLSGDHGLQFSRQELLNFLSGGVVLDGPALARLNEMGLSEHTGFRIRGSKDRDTMEIFTADAINSPFAGWRRDCRPSFYPEPGWLIEPLGSASRPLSEIVDFTPSNFGATSGVFENQLGGRVAVLGYYPWRSLQSLAKTSQMKSICRWLSRDRLPAYVGSYAKVALWCRRSPEGRSSILLLNASLDRLEKVSLHVRDAAEVELTRLCGRSERVKRTVTDGPYGVFEIADLGPWTPALLVAKA